jgi:hypothetical protein
MTEREPIFGDATAALLNARAVSPLCESLAIDDEYGMPFFSRLAMRELVAALKAMQEGTSSHNFFHALQLQLQLQSDGDEHVSNIGDTSE